MSKVPAARNHVLSSAIAIALITPTVPPAAFGAEGLEEVIVTAERREESAQKTPISMTVYAGEAASAAGVHDVASLSRVDPSIIASASEQARVATRGAGAGALTWPGLLRRLDRSDPSYAT